MMNGDRKDFWISLNGDSMFPFLKHGDEVLIHSLGVEEIKVGDILLFVDQDSRELTLHRLMNFPLKTKGDFGKLFECNPSDNFLGKAIFFRRNSIVYEIKNGKWFTMLSRLRARGKLVSVIALAGLYVSAAVWRFYNAKARSGHSRVPDRDDLSLSV